MELQDAALMHTTHHSYPFSTAVSSMAATSSYLPDLLPLQAHDLLQQSGQHNHYHDILDIHSKAFDQVLLGTNMGVHQANPMLEGLQPIRKEEIVRLRNDGGGVTIVETQHTSKYTYNLLPFSETRLKSLYSQKP